MDASSYEREETVGIIRMPRAGRSRGTVDSGGVDVRGGSLGLLPGGGGMPGDGDRIGRGGAANIAGRSINSAAASEGGQVRRETTGGLALILL